MSLVNAYFGSLWKPRLIAWKSDCVLENKMSIILKPGTKTKQAWNLKSSVCNAYAVLHELGLHYAKMEPSHRTQTESRSDTCIKYTQ